MIGGPRTIVVFFDMVGVLEEFSHVQQLYFDKAQLAPDSTYAEEGVRALDAAIRDWQRAGHEVFLVCVSGVRAEFTRAGLIDYLQARGFDPARVRLHEQYNAPKRLEADDAPDAIPMTKGKEVELWLAANHWDACVVFDDCNDGYRKGLFVHVDPELGLSEENVEKGKVYIARQLAAG